METAERWRTTLRDGDEDGFREAVEPLMPDLIRTARQDIQYYVRQGAIHQDDFSPEEVAGEAVIFAWEHRDQIPEQLSLRGWLLGILYRALAGMVEAQRQYRYDKALSLDEEIPPNPDALFSQEWFWDWYQPEPVETWGDVTPSVEPVDFEIPLAEEESVLNLDRDLRHAIIMHDEFEMDITEVAFIMGQNVKSVATMLQTARGTLREWMVKADANDGTAVPPAPPEEAEGLG